MSLSDIVMGLINLNYLTLTFGYSMKITENGLDYLNQALGSAPQIKEIQINFSVLNQENQELLEILNDVISIRDKRSGIFANYL